MAFSFDKDKIKVVLFESIHQNAVDTFKKAGYNNVELLHRAYLDDELIERLKGVKIIGIRSKTKITRKVLENSPSLKAIACYCIGTNQVDLEAARELGVAVFNSPYSNTRSVAELVIAEIVMLMRGIPQKNAAAHRGEWLKVAVGSFEVRGKTLGIIGYGHIGSQVSVLAEGMGMKVIYYDIVPKLPMGNAQSVSSLEELLSTSDVVSLHVPGTPMTKNMIKAEQLSLMKKDAALINLSRGNVIDINALKAALESGHLRGAALDVYPVEPKSKAHKFISELQGLDNVILTPHIGGSTQEAQENIGIDAATKSVNYFNNGSTVGSHSIPELHLPRQQGTSRIFHIHKNVPGVISKINGIVSGKGINIISQYLNTKDDIGYVVIDIEQKVNGDILSKLKEIEGTMWTRVNYV